MQSLRILAIPTFCLIVFGCAIPSSVPGSRPAPVPPPAKTINTSSQKKEIGESWHISPTNEIHTYSSFLASTIQQTGISQARGDSLIIRTEYSIKFTRVPETTTFEGAIIAFALQSWGRILQEQIPQSIFPFTFTGNLTKDETHIQPGNSAAESTLKTCENPIQTILAAVQRNTLTVPLEMRIGLSWQDSLSSTLCNGTFPTKILSIRNYTVLREDSFHGVPAFFIDRKDKTLSTGEGSQDQHQITIKTESDGTTKLYADRITGSLLSAEVITLTNISVESSGKIQHFIQNSKEIVKVMK